MYERDRQTDGGTDTAWRHRPRLHSIARQKAKSPSATGQLNPHRRVAKPKSYFSTPNVKAIFRRRPTLTGSSNAGRVGKNRDSERIAGYRSMTAGHASNYCDGRPCSLPHRCTDASLNLSITACNMAEYAKEKRTVQNIVLVLGSKAEAEVTTNKRQISSAASSLSGVRCKALAANAIWSIFRSNNASAGYHTNADYICS